METEALADAAREFDRVVLARDRPGAERILHDDFALMTTHPTSAVMPREGWLEVLDDYLVHSWDLEEQRMDVSDRVGAVMTRLRMRATVLGQDRSGLFVMSDVWLQGDDGWRVWRRHSAPLSAGPLPGA